VPGGEGTEEKRGSGTGFGAVGEARARVRVPARGNIVIKICTSTLRFPRATSLGPPPPRDLRFAGRDGVVCFDRV